MNLFFLPLVTLLALTTALPALPFTNHSAAAVIKRTLASGGTVPAETFHSEVLSSAAECGEKDWDRAPDGNDGWCPETSEDNNKCQFLANLWVSGIFVRFLSLIHFNFLSCSFYDTFVSKQG